MKKLFSNNIILFFMLLILNLCFTISVYAVDFDDSENTDNQLPDGALYVSDFGKNGDGYIEVGWKAKDKTGKEVYGNLIYYKYVYGKNPDGNLVGLWLYNSSDSQQDEELKQMILNKENDIQELINVYSNGQVVNNPELYTSAYFMWPVSSNGNFILTGKEENAQEIIKMHDIHDFTEVSKPENFCLVSTINYNFDNTLNTNLPNYNYPIPNSKSLYDSWLNEASFKIGIRYKNRYLVSGNQRHFVNTSQDFLKHQSYMAANYAGSQQGAIELTLQSKNNYNPQNDKLNPNKKDKSFYEKQYTFFLTSPVDGQILTPQRVYSADKLFSLDTAPTFPRSTSSALGIRNFGDVNPKQIYQNRIVNNYFNFNSGMCKVNNKLDEIVPNFSNTNKLTSLQNWDNIPPLFLLTLQSTIYTYEGAYWKLTDLAVKTYSDINIAIPRFNEMLTIENFIKMGKEDYNSYYQMECLLTLVLNRYFLVSGFASQNSPGGLVYISAPSGTTWGGYNLPVLNFDDSLINFGNVSTGDVKIVNEITEDINSSIIICDLAKSLNVSEKDLYEFTSNYYKNKSEAPVGNMTKRSAKMLAAGLSGNNSIGVYLTKSEREKGQIQMTDGELEHLQPDRVYVVCASLMYEKNIPPERIPEILNKNEIYNISNYKDIHFDKKEEDKKENEEELKQ